MAEPDHTPTDGPPDPLVADLIRAIDHRVRLDLTKLVAVAEAAADHVRPHWEASHAFEQVAAELRRHPAWPRPATLDVDLAPLDVYHPDDVVNVAHRLVRQHPYVTLDHGGPTGARTPTTTDLDDGTIVSVYSACRDLIATIAAGCVTNAQRAAALRVVSNTLADAWAQAAAEGLVDDPTAEPPITIDEWAGEAGR